MPNIVSGIVTRTGRMSKTITVSVKRHIEHPKLLKVSLVQVYFGQD